MTQHFSNKKSEGFTLIEIIVSMAIFSIVMLGVMSVFFLALRAQRVVMLEKATAESVRFSLEFMSRQMRFAQRAEDTACLSQVGLTFESVTPSGIRFINGISECITFNRDPLKFITYVNTTDPLTAQLTNESQVSIDSLEFIIVGSVVAPNDLDQPRVTIVIRASGGGGTSEAQNVALNVQTTVTARQLDVL